MFLWWFRLCVMEQDIPHILLRTFYGTIPFVENLFTALSYQDTQPHFLAYHDGFIDSSNLEDLRKPQVVGSLHSAEQRVALTPGALHSKRSYLKGSNLAKSPAQGHGSGVMNGKAMRVVARGSSSCVC